MSCLEKNCQHADYNLIAEHCSTSNIKLTPLREAVLKIICNAQKPLTAYAILDELCLSKPKSQVMSVYRILNFLLENAIIHRIESLNAVILCHHIHNGEHTSQWLICYECGEVTECDLPSFEQSLEIISKQTGFNVTAPIIELSGICTNCQISSA